MAQLRDPRDKALFLLRSDSLAGIAAGCLTFLATPFVLAWYQWSLAFTLFVASANVVYGCYSGFLFLGLKRKNQLSARAAAILVVGNGIWAGNCFVQAWALREQASFLGTAHLVLEGLFVGGLAGMEARGVLGFARQAGLESAVPSPGGMGNLPGN